MEQLLLLPGKCQRIFGIHGGEFHIQHRIFPAVYGYNSLFKINLFQKPPAVHLILWMAFDNLAFHFKLNYCYCLVHFGCQPRIYRIVDILIQNMGGKSFTGVIPVGIGRKHGQRAQIYAVPILQNIKAVVADGNPKHIADTGRIPCDRPHPGDIMIAPLDIHIMKIHQFIHNQIGSGPSVKDISDNMQAVYGKALNQLTQSTDKFPCNPHVNDGADNLTVEHFFIIPIVIHMEHLIYNICKIRRQLLADLGTGILGGDYLTDLQQPVYGDSLPVLRIIAGLYNLIQYLVRIIDQIGQLLFLCLGNHISECLFYLLTDDSRGAS